MGHHIGRHIKHTVNHATGHHIFNEHSGGGGGGGGSYTPPASPPPKPPKQYYVYLSSSGETLKYPLSTKCNGNRYIKFWVSNNEYRYLNFFDKVPKNKLHIFDTRNGVTYYPLQTNEFIFKFFDACSCTPKYEYRTFTYTERRRCCSKHDTQTITSEYTKKYPIDVKPLEIKNGYEANEMSKEQATNHHDYSDHSNTYYCKNSFMLLPKFIINFETNADIGNYDSIKVHVTVVNIHTNASITKTWCNGTGDNWSGIRNGSFVFSSNEIEELGGVGASVYFKTYLYEDRGSSKTCYRFTCHFDAITSL